jgi:2-(1,2-epoxy-1,2-dihydrophenyl)acetyl-CoA isomerase
MNFDPRMTTPIKTESHDGVLEIILNRPERRNAMTMEMFDALEAALNEAEKPEVRCVIVRGEGSHFCVGGDIRVFAEVAGRGESIPEAAPDHLHRSIERIRALEKPVLAVVHGSCAGAGLSLVLACDLAVAADDAQFNLAYVGIGLSPDGGSTYFLPRHVGAKKAMEIFMTGATMAAVEAQALGLINRVVPASEALDQGRAMAHILASGPTLAYARLKKLLGATFENSLQKQLALESKFFSASSKTEDFREGVAAFLAKRAPEFHGK